MTIARLCLAACLAIPAQPAPQLTPGPLVTWLIFVDDLHLDFRHTGRIRDMLRTIVKELAADGDRVAMASSGPSALGLAATDDQQEIGAAIRKVTGNALRFEDMQAAGDLREVRYRAETAIAAAQNMLGTANGYPVMVFVSNGYGHTPPDILERMAALTAAAQQSAIRIFTVHPSAAFNSTQPIVPDPAWDTYVDAATASLRSISDSTGAFPIARNDFVPQLRRLTSMVRH